MKFSEMTGAESEYFKKIEKECNDFIKEVDRTLDNLKNHKLVLSVEKNNGVDCVKYTIKFSSAEGAFMFGLSRPQIKI
mgnify:CR=1 FL=1